VSRNGRWASPKYLIGESYGTTRSAVLGNRLERDGMSLNGIVLISSVLDFETLLFAPGHDLSYELYLPSYAATAVYHKVIPAPANAYLRGELKFDTQDRYVMGGGVQWSWAREGQRGWAATTYVGTDLTQALVSNPHLRIEIENGYYDLATPFFATEYTVSHLE